MKSLATIINLLLATAVPLTVANPTTSTTTAVAVDEAANAKYTTVCPYSFCFKRFGYKCNGKGKMTKKKSFEGCEAGCYCRKKSLHDDGAERDVVEEMDLGEEYETHE